MLDPDAPEVSAMASALDATRDPQQLVRTAADIMSSPVVTVSPTDSVWTAWALLYRCGLRHLVVVEGGRCIGVIDDRRICAEWPLLQAGQHRGTVAEVLPRRTRCVLSSTPLGILARIMLHDHIEAVPVVGPTAEILGLVTISDLLRELVMTPDMGNLAP
jgi:acetoin utilization protein AcuB